MTDLKTDRTEILAMIEAETNAYLRRDYDAWEQCWHDGPEIRRIHSHVGTGVTILEGPEIRERMRRILEAQTEWRRPETLRRENLNVVVTPEMAWVSYDQIGDMSGTREELAGRYHELKILQKFHGCWKLTCIVGTQIRIDHVNAPLVEVDPQARLLWMNEAARNRLPVHPRLGIRGNLLKAADPETQREMLDALSWIDEIRDRHTPCVGEDSVIRAVALGQDDTGLAHVCWAVLRDGKLLVTFDDTDRLERQLASAGEVYGLSGTQERLARLLVDGSDLGACAEQLGISLNTVKTHLQRVYDKTGVRAQPALVRLLLSADRRSI